MKNVNLNQLRLVIREVMGRTEVPGDPAPAAAGAKLRKILREALIKESLKRSLKNAIKK